jgi:hypothetical protein
MYFECFGLIRKNIKFFLSVAFFQMKKYNKQVEVSVPGKIIKVEVSVTFKNIKAEVSVSCKK